MTRFHAHIFVFTVGAAFSNTCALEAGPFGIVSLVELPVTPGYANIPKGRIQWLKCHGALGNTPQQLWDKFHS